MTTDNSINAQFQRALKLHRQGELNEAARLYQQVLQSQPAHFDALHMLGALAMQKSQAGAAIRLLTRALQQNPRSAAAFSNLSAALNGARRYTAALDAAGRALQLSPQFAPAHHNRALALAGLQKNRPALESFNRALALDPDNAETLVKRGALLLTMNRRGKALLGYRRAIRLSPRLAEAHDGEGNALRWLNRPADATQSYERALRLQPRNHRMAVNSAICHLIVGDYAAGFTRYERRLYFPAVRARKPATRAPRLTADTPVKGQTILVWAEQGLGDVLHFCRYIPRLSENGATTILHAPTAMVELLRGQHGFGTVIAPGAELPRHDLQCPLLSLPHVLATRPDTIPAAVPYLRPPAPALKKWRQKLGQAKGRRAGLVWSGHRKNPNERNRAISLSALLAATDRGPGLISLQKDITDTDRQTLAGHPGIIHVGDELQDFADTAGVMAQLDLVISVDTAAAHLAGAMGVPVFLLLPFAPDWRWMLGRDDSPWYPTMRLFRQPRIGDWGSVIEELRRAVTGFSAR